MSPPGLFTNTIAPATKSEYHVNIQCDPGAMKAIAKEIHDRLEENGLRREYHEPVLSDKPTFAVTFCFTGDEANADHALPSGYALLADTLAALGYELKGVPSEANGRLFVKSNEPRQHGYKIMDHQADDCSTSVQRGPQTS